jgi:hypothetical protein
MTMGKEQEQEHKRGAEVQLKKQLPCFSFDG